MRGIILLVFTALISGIIQAQSVKGKLVDLVENKPLAGATLELRSVRDTTNRYGAVSDSSGHFLFSNLPLDSFSFHISFIGYENYKQFVSLTDSLPDLDLQTLFIPKSTRELGGVTVVSRTPPAQQKGDTTQYNASQFKVNPDATVEDLVKKMPGITVDRDGTVTAQGEQVRKVTIDGRDFFGDDASAALRNLPSEVVDKIQVFDRLSDQAQATGVDDGNAQKAINIVTKAGMRNGQFGRIYAGAGTDDRYQAGGNVSFFKENRRISLVGLANNINQQNFGSQDLLGLTSSGGGGNRGGGNFGGGGRGGGGGGFRGGGQDNFLVGQQSGVSKTNAIGINYSDKWGLKTDVSGSYFFNNSNNDNNRLSNTQSFVKADSTLFLDDQSVSATTNYNHRLNFRLEYRIDSSNTIIITPNLGFQKNEAENSTSSSSYYDLVNGGLQSEANSRTQSLNSGYNFNNNILFRHSFPKRGRSFSVNVNTSFNRKNGENYLESVNKYYNNTNINDSIRQFSDNETSGRTISTNLVYTEPIGAKGQLQFNFNPSFTRNKADKVTYQFDELGGKYTVFDTTLSNKFDNTYNTQNGGITYRLGERDNQFSVGLSYQNSTLNSEQFFPEEARVNRSFSNFLPNIQFRRKLSPRSSIRIFYRSSVNAPSVSQLQNVIDNTNPLRISTGNPALDQEYTHRFVTRYTYTNTQKGQSFFANLFLQKTNDYVANATYTAFTDSLLAPGIVLYKGSQLTKPVNLDGYWSLRSFFTYGQPVKFIKSNVNLNAGFTYSRLPGLVNNVKTISDNFTYNAGLVVASNINEYIDFNISYSANFSVVKNSLQPQLNQDYITQTASLQLNLLAKSGWFLQHDLSYQGYSGLSEGFNQRFWLWNAGAGKKFFKDRRGELKLSVFDLLKQNQSITRTVGDSYIQDVQNLVLRQYYMLTFTYSLKNFGKAKTNGNQRRDRGPMF